MSRPPNDSALSSSVPGAAPATDAELATRILRGDVALFELVMRRYNRLLFRIARSIVTDPDEARDAVQAAYIRAYYHLDQFRGPGGMQSWLARITINEAASRRRKPAAARFDNDALAALPGLENDEPERSNISEEALSFLQQAIDELPEEFRSVLVLRGVEQLSTAETAAALDLKEATVKTRFHRARLLLRSSLGRHAEYALPDVFPFDGEHCNRIVATVLAAVRPCTH